MYGLRIHKDDDLLAFEYNKDLFFKIGNTAHGHDKVFVLWHGDRDINRKSFFFGQHLYKMRLYENGNRNSVGHTVSKQFVRYARIGRR